MFNKKICVHCRKSLGIFPTSLSEKHISKKGFPFWLCGQCVLSLTLNNKYYTTILDTIKELDKEETSQN